jgi:hypothetical protein
MELFGPTSAKTGNATSTGRFAGATGFYFMSGVAAPAPDGSFTGQGQLIGQVCYAANGAH